MTRVSLQHPSHSHQTLAGASATVLIANSAALFTLACLSLQLSPLCFASMIGMESFSFSALTLSLLTQKKLKKPKKARAQLAEAAKVNPAVAPKNLQMEIAREAEIAMLGEAAVATQIQAPEIAQVGPPTPTVDELRASLGKKFEALLEAAGEVLSALAKAYDGKGSPSIKQAVKSINTTLQKAFREDAFLFKLVRRALIRSEVDENALATALPTMTIGSIQQALKSNIKTKNEEFKALLEEMKFSSSDTKEAKKYLRELKKVKEVGSPDFYRHLLDLSDLFFKHLDAQEGLKTLLPYGIEVLPDPFAEKIVSLAEDFPNMYEEGGLFKSKLFRGTMYFATSRRLKGRVINWILARIDEQPLEKKDREEIKEKLEPALHALLNPLYYSTVGKKHELYRKVKGHVAPKVPELAQNLKKEGSWEEKIERLITLFKQFSKLLAQDLQV